MAFDDDQFPPSLPAYQSPPQVVDANMTEAVNTGAHDFYDSHNYFFDSDLDPEYAEFASQKPSPPTLTSGHSALIAPSTGSSLQGSSSGSQRNSLDTSDDSLGDIHIEDGQRVPGRIAIPADTADERSSAYSSEERVTGNDFFDFDSAGSSPSHPGGTLNASSIKMPIRAAQNGFGHTSAHQKSYEGSPLSISSRHNRHSSELQPQYVHGSLLQISSNIPTVSKSPPATAYLTQHTPVQLKNEQPPPWLHVSNLPRSQRVETQMHVRLTLWPLPEGVTQLHFQRHTMARTKLVLKPTPPKSPSMLELYAHCVCETPMENPEMRRLAYERAAQSARRDDPGKDEGRFSPRSMEMADDDPQKPINGGFAFICPQCIRRESKRNARKKIKNDVEEESWLKEQPKRIIVFNKAEIMDWRDWQSYQDDGEVDERTQRLHANQPHFPDGAMQIRFPMRLQCYSRHHGEEFGYRVIFTIKDWQDCLIAQTMTNAAIITDDHKTQQSSTPVSEAQDPKHFDNQNLPIAGIPSQVGTINHGLPLFNRNSFSTTDLQSLQLSHYQQTQQQQCAFGYPGDYPRTNRGLPSTHNLSRPASPSAPSGPQSKRRKGSGNGSGRLRSDLTMTKINPTGTRYGGGSPSVPFLASGPNPSQPFSPNYASPHGLSTPPASAYVNSTPPTPNTFNLDFYQRSQSVENLQSHQPVFSAPTSAYHSEVPSPESSPQSQSQAYSRSQTQLQGHEFEMPSIHTAHDPNTDNRPMISKVTPAEGPKAGGIEVTCLGKGFHRGIEVFFGDVPAVTSRLFGDQAIVCLLPPSAQPGLVAVTVRSALDRSSIQPLREPTLFNYIDHDEKEMIKQALQVVSQQFSGTSGPAYDFARKILSSFGPTSTVFDSGSSAPNQQHRKATTYRDEPFDLKDLESVVLKCLEIVDLDDNPNRVNLNFRGDCGRAMLHISASLGYYRLVAGLLARGAHPDVRDDNGMTPIHMASLNGNVQIIRKLRSAGADPTIRSLNGTRPADIASTPRARRTVDELGYHSRSRSSESTPVKHLSRVNSLQSSKLHQTTKLPTMPSVSIADPSSLVGVEGNRSYRPQPNTAFPTWSQSRSASQRHSQHLHMDKPENTLNSDAAAFAATPAMSAWRDQMSAQIQQIQQSLHRALPPIPNLPDYQAYPVMRRISNLVPQRGPRADSIDRDEDRDRKLKCVDYGWWEFITGLSSSPPAYDEIYPAPAQQNLRKNPSSALRPVGDASLDQKTQTLYSPPKSASVMETVNIGCSGLSKQQQQQLMIAHAHKMKKLRSDRRLFFIWIPLLLFIVVAMFKDQAPQFWRFIHYTEFLRGDQSHGSLTEVA